MNSEYINLNNINREDTWVDVEIVTTKQQEWQ